MRTRQEPAQEVRPKRTPINKRDILSVKGKEPGYHYRIVNDIGDRTQSFVDAGYEFVDASSVTIGDKRVNRASPEGSKAQVSVGAGQKAYLMRIKQEWYDEDQAAKQQEVQKLEQSMRQQALSQNELKNGKLEISQG